MRSTTVLRIGPALLSLVLALALPAVPAGAQACAAAELTGEIGAWDGAAGHRIASIKLHNAGSAECLLPKLLRPALVEASGTALIVGAKVSNAATIMLGAGADASSMVDMANYCGKAPSSTLAIRLYLADETSVEIPATGDLAQQADPPPCNGRNAPAEIQMQPLQPGTRY
jgi:hypothetical protein